MSSPKGAYLVDISVIAGPSSLELATGISRHLESHLISSELRVFADGESKIRLKGNVRKKCVVVQSTYPPPDTHLIQDMMMIRKCADEGAEVCAVIPYLAYARQDKEFLEGEVVSASLIARLLEASGARSIVTVEIHSLAALAFFSNITNISSIPVLAEYAAKMNLTHPIVVSPDTGGIARAQQFANILKTDMIALKKSRDRITGEVSMVQDIDVDIAGRDSILIDDMISSGSSIIKAAEVLHRNHVGKVYAMCAHALLINDAASKITSAGVQKIIATNSIPGIHSSVDLSKTIATAVKKAIS